MYGSPCLLLLCCGCVVLFVVVCFRVIDLILCCLVCFVVFVLLMLLCIVVICVCLRCFELLDGCCSWLLSLCVLLFLYIRCFQNTYVCFICICFWVFVVAVFLFLFSCCFVCVCVCFLMSPYAQSLSILFRNVPCEGVSISYVIIS